jgi:hypothetical protein
MAHGGTCVPPKQLDPVYTSRVGGAERQLSGFPVQLLLAFCLGGYSSQQPRLQNPQGAGGEQFPGAYLDLGFITDAHTAEPSARSYFACWQFVKH